MESGRSGKSHAGFIEAGSSQGRPAGDGGRHLDRPDGPVQCLRFSGVSQIVSGESALTATALLQESDVFRMSKDQYLRVWDSGILGDCEDIEFVEGLLLTMPAHTPRHNYTLEVLDDLFRK